MENAIKFYSKSKEMRCLSNFSTVSVIVDNKRYATGEAAFHAAKFKTAALLCRAAGDEERERKLMLHSAKFTKVADPKTAKKYGGRKACELTKEEQMAWVRESEAIQKIICYEKLKSDEVVTALLASGDQYLLHQENRAKASTPWGGRIDKKTGQLVGQNKLGKIWMGVRDSDRFKELTGAGEGAGGGKGEAGGEGAGAGKGKTATSSEA